MLCEVRRLIAKKGNKGTEGDNLPFCYASFELIQHMIRASKKKQKEGKMDQSRDLYVRGDDKKKLSCNPSPATDTSGVCDEASSHR